MLFCVLLPDLYLVAFAQKKTWQERIHPDFRQQHGELTCHSLSTPRPTVAAINPCGIKPEEFLAAAEPAELLVSSPEQPDSGKNAAETAEHSSSSSVGTPAAFPSSQSTVHPNLYSFSLPAAAEHGIDDFLMKNAAVGRLSGSAQGATKNATSAR